MLIHLVSVWCFFLLMVTIITLLNNRESEELRKKTSHDDDGLFVVSSGWLSDLMCRFFFATHQELEWSFSFFHIN